MYLLVLVEVLKGLYVCSKTQTPSRGFIFGRGLYLRGRLETWEGGYSLNTRSSLNHFSFPETSTEI